MFSVCYTVFLMHESDSSVCFICLSLLNIVDRCLAGKVDSLTNKKDVNFDCAPHVNLPLSPVVFRGAEGPSFVHGNQKAGCRKTGLCPDDWHVSPLSHLFDGYQNFVASSF